MKTFKGDIKKGDTNMRHEHETLKGDIKRRR